jgi:hypothetical protein
MVKIQENILISLAIYPARNLCRIAQARIYSGTRRAHKNNGNWVVNIRDRRYFLFFQNPILCVSSVAGILGWMATHVQRKMVERQLQMMPHIVLHLLISLHVDPSLSSGSVEAGVAVALANNSSAKRKSIPR